MPEEKDNAQQQPEKDAGKDAAGKKGGKMLLWIIIGTILVVEIPVMYVVIQATRPKSPEEISAARQADSLKTVTKQKTVMGATTETPIEAVVNIMGTDGDRYLKVAVVFEYDNAQYPGLAAELARRGPR